MDRIVRAFFRDGSCPWPSSFRLCSLVRPSDCFLVNCIGRATTYFFLAATASLLFYTWAPWPKWCCSSCAKFIASCSSYFPKNGSSSRNGGQGGKGEIQRGRFDGRMYMPRKLRCPMSSKTDATYFSSSFAGSFMVISGRPSYCGKHKISVFSPS